MVVTILAPQSCNNRKLNQKDITHQKVNHEKQFFAFYNYTPAYLL